MASRMVSPSGAQALPGRRPVTQRRGIAAIMHEPLLQFILIGAVLFGISTVTAPGPDRSRVIEVTPAVRAEMQAILRSRNNREPTEAELRPLLDQWLINEVLFREALALGLDRGDTALHDRLVQKMNVMVFQQAAVALPDRKTLEAWYADHAQRFAIPASVSFLAVPFSGAQAEADARATLAAIGRGEEPPSVRSSARVFFKRPLESIDPAFGPGVLDQLRGLGLGRWGLAHGAVPGSMGGETWYVVRVDGNTVARTPKLDEVLGEAAETWREETTKKAARAALRALASQYIIRGASLPAD